MSSNRVDKSILKVGDVLEYSLNDGRTWWSCEIKYIVSDEGVVCRCFLGSGNEREQFFKFTKVIFKSAPPKTKVIRVLDQTEDEFIKHAVEIWDGMLPTHQWFELYRAGCRFIDQGDSND